MKYAVIVAIFLAVESLCMFSLYKSERSKRIALEHEKNSLIETMEKHNNAEVVASKTIQKIQERVKYIKSPCDCYNASIDDPLLLDWLRGNKK